MKRTRIVVGVDDSAASRAALRWASGEAQRSGADIRVVFVYSAAASVALQPGELQPLAVDAADVRKGAFEMLRRVVTDAGLCEGPTVRLEAIDDPSPAHALVRAAADASLLVVGEHRRRGLGVLLGSTANGCIRHARCPVVVVPEDQDGPTKLQGGARHEDIRQSG